MKKIVQKAIYAYLILVNSTCWAGLPKPPSADTANGNQDWILTGKNMVFAMIGYAAIAGGSVILAGIALNMFNAYQVAQEKQDLGHFFKHLMVGLLVAAMTSAIMYVAYTTVTE